MVTKTRAVQLKDTDSALLSNLRRMAREHGGPGTAAYLDLLNRVDFAFEIEESPVEPAPEWHSPPEDVAPGTFTGKPTSEADRDRIIEASAGGQSVSEGYPFKPLAGQFCRCGLLYAFVAGTVVCHCGHTLTGPNRRVSFRAQIGDLAQSFETAAETAASLGTGPKPSADCVPPLAAEIAEPKHLVCAKHALRVKPGERCPECIDSGPPPMGAWTRVDPAAWAAAIDGEPAPEPILSRNDVREMWFRQDDDAPEPGSKPPLGAVPDFIWRRLRAMELSGAIERYLAAAGNPDCDNRNLPSWAAELAEHLRWLREAK